MKIMSRTKIKAFLEICKEKTGEDDLGIFNVYADGKCSYVQMMWMLGIASYEKETGKEVTPDERKEIYDYVVSETRNNRWSDDVADHRYWVDTSYTLDHGWETMVFARNADGSVNYEDLDVCLYEEPEDAMEGHEKMCLKWSLK